MIRALILAAALTVTPHTVAAPAPIQFASAGDSISALADNNGKIIWWSWVRDAVGDGGLKYVGVYMRAGADTAMLAAHAAPTKAAVMVVLAGTNDVSQGVDPNLTMRNINRIFADSQTPHRVLVAIPPRNLDHVVQTTALNVIMARYAAAEGWVFVDPWTTVREPDGTWAPGTSSDKLHPSVATGQVVGAIMNTLIRKTVAP